jgi:hypothetical protein
MTVSCPAFFLPVLAIRPRLHVMGECIMAGAVNKKDMPKISRFRFVGPTVHASAPELNPLRYAANAGKNGKIQ